MSKKPKIDHDYDAGKDKLTITIHRYSLKSKKTRNAIIQKLMANFEGASDRLVADAKKESNKKGLDKKKLEVSTRNDVPMPMTGNLLMPAIRRLVEIGLKAKTK